MCVLRQDKEQEESTRPLERLASDLGLNQRVNDTPNISGEISVLWYVQIIGRRDPADIQDHSIGRIDHLRTVSMLLKSI